MNALRLVSLNQKERGRWIIGLIEKNLKDCKFGEGAMASSWWRMVGFMVEGWDLWWRVMGLIDLVFCRLSFQSIPVHWRTSASSPKSPNAIQLPLTGFNIVNLAIRLDSVMRARVESETVWRRARSLSNEAPPVRFFNVDGIALHGNAESTSA